MPGKSTPNTPSSILFRPQQLPPLTCRSSGSWWRRRVPPPGPNGLLRCPFITIAERVGGRNIGDPWRKKKPDRASLTIWLKSLFSTPSPRLRGEGRGEGPKRTPNLRPPLTRPPATLSPPKRGEGNHLSLPNIRNRETPPSGKMFSLTWLTGPIFPSFSGPKL